jgi:hypothetical protein
MVVIQSLDEGDFQGRRLALPGRVVVLFRMATCPYSRAFRAEYGHLRAPEGVLLADYVLGNFYERLPLTFDIAVVPSVLGFEEGTLRWRENGTPGRGLGEATLARILSWGTRRGPPSPPGGTGPGPGSGPGTSPGA